MASKASASANYANGARHFVSVQAIRIAGAVGALVMPAHDLRNLRPGKLHVAYDLVADGGVVAHGAGLFVVER